MKDLRRIGDILGVKYGGFVKNTSVCSMGLCRSLMKIENTYAHPSGPTSALIFSINVPNMSV